MTIYITVITAMGIAVIKAMMIVTACAVMIMKDLPYQFLVSNASYTLCRYLSRIM